jgi:hypothetical protein
LPTTLSHMFGTLEVNLPHLPHLPTIQPGPRSSRWLLRRRRRPPAAVVVGVEGRADVLAAWWNWKRSSGKGFRVLRRGAARGGRDQRVSQSLSCIPKVRRAPPFLPVSLSFGWLDSHIARGSVSLHCVRKVGDHGQAIDFM